MYLGFNRLFWGVFSFFLFGTCLIMSQIIMLCTFSLVGEIEVSM